MTPVKSTLIALTAVAALATPALASDSSLAKDVGVAPGTYSHAQLMQLKGDEPQAVRAYILAHPTNPNAPPVVVFQPVTASPAPAGNDKLAGSVGVQPGRFSTDQLIALESLGNGGPGNAAAQWYILNHPANGS